MADKTSKGVEGGRIYFTLVTDGSKFAKDAEKEIDRGVSDGVKKGAKKGSSEAGKELKERLGKTGKAAGLAAGAGIALGLKDAMGKADLEGTIKAKLGTGNPELAKDVAKSAGEAYTAGWGESLEGIAGTTAILGQALDSLKDKGNLTELTKQTTAIAETFDQDAKQVAETAEKMVRNGLATNMTEAVDIVAKGFQSNSELSDDMLDSLSEYGSAFGQLGLSGADAITAMNQGLDSGAWTGDAVSDSVREHMIKIQEMGKEATAALDLMGISTADMQAAMAEGGPAAKAALGEMLAGLKAIDDPVKRNTAAIALFGPKAEEMQAALYSLDFDTPAAGMKDLEGTAKDLAANSAGFDQTVRAMGRTLSDGLGEALTPLLPQLLDLSGIGLDFFKWMADHPVVTQIILAIGAGLGIATAAMWAFNAAQLANPTTWIMAGIIAGVALLITAIWWLATNWDQAMDAMYTAGEFVTVGLLHAVNGLIKALNGIGQLAGIIMPGKQDWGNMPLLDVPGLATGGTVTGRGTVLVGEEGPELLNLSRGASVIPLDHPAAGTGNGGPTLIYHAAENRSFDAEAELQAALGKTTLLGR